MPRLMCSALLTVVLALPTLLLAAQETSKPVPRDSMRVYVEGCTKGTIFTAGERSEDLPGGNVVAAGTHMRMNGKKELINDIRRREGQRVQLTGLVRRNDLSPSGWSLGHGISVGPGTPSARGANEMPSPTAGQILIDVENFKPVPGECPRR